MKVALDTNVLLDLWANTTQGQLNAATLSTLTKRGDTLWVSGAIRAELAAHPSMSAALIENVLNKMGIRIDWFMSDVIWNEVGRAHAAASARRRANGLTQPRRPLADHIIGAHALHRADALLTRNTGDFSDFPTLTIIPA